MKSTSILMFIFILSAILSGCSSAPAKPIPSRTETETSRIQEEENIELPASISESFSESALSAAVPATIPPAIPASPQTKPVLPSTIYRSDWESYFGELYGAAIIFDPTENTFQIYHEELADTRRSPCSTFKIISSLAGLENGIIDLENSIRFWSGEIFWNDNWNRDINFYTAFQTSCVWYYRQIIDEIGSEIMQDTLDALQYGNGDLSDWSGSLNTNNHNPSLTGFWIESSLKISPREQTQVLERIFGSASEYSPETRKALEEVMFLPEASDETCAIYGKTGMGKANGVVVDAWYTGFADIGHRIYFCVYLGETTNQNVSSTRAKEIAISLLKE